MWSEDQAGNQAAPTSVTLRYDPGPPSGVRFSPARPATLGAAELQIPETFAATAGPSGVYGYQVTVDAPPSGGLDQVNSFGSFDISNLSTGTHTIFARAFSGAGVAGPVRQVTLTVNRQAP